MSWRLLLAVFSLSLAFGAAAQTGLKVPKAKPRAEVPAASADEAERSKIIERVFECLAAGLPKDWWRAWVEIVERGEVSWNERNLEGRFFYLTDAERTKPQDLKPCDAKEIAELTYSLNQFLDLDKRRWKLARLAFNRDGSFELKYDYGQ